MTFITIIFEICHHRGLAINLMGLYHPQDQNGGPVGVPALFYRPAWCSSKIAFLKWAN